MLGPLFDGLLEAQHQAGTSTARVLTGMYRASARQAGVPGPLTKSLRVRYDRSDAGFDYNLPQHLEALEYGDLSHPPVAFRRKAMAAHSVPATRLFDRLVALHHNPPVL